MATLHFLRNSALAAIIFALGLNAQPPRHSLAVIVHKSSPLDKISVAELRKMIGGETRVWPDSTPVVLVEQPEENATQKEMLRMVLKTSPEGYNRQLLQLQFQGRQSPLIRILNSDANAIAFVWNVPGALSIVDAAAATANAAHVKTLKIDGKLPGEPGYLLQ